VMARNLMTVGPAETLQRAATVMVESRVHRVFVLDAEGRVAGVIGARDLMRAICDERVRTPIEAFLHRPIVTVEAAQPVAEAAARLVEARVNSLVVVDGEDWPVGVFGQDEALEARHLSGDTPVERVMAAAVVALETDVPLHVAAAELAGGDARVVVGVDHGRLRGILGGLDFARVVQTDAATSPVHDLACPRDGALLTHTRYAADVEVQVCPRCRGLWLDRESLRRLEGQPPDAPDAPDESVPADVEKAFALARERKGRPPACLRCARRMERREYAYCSQILIDTCPYCRGVWLDGGELDAIERFLVVSREHAQASARGLFRRMMTTII